MILCKGLHVNNNEDYLNRIFQITHAACSGEAQVKKYILRQECWSFFFSICDVLLAERPPGGASTFSLQRARKILCQGFVFTAVFNHSDNPPKHVSNVQCLHRRQVQQQTPKGFADTIR